jgi:hypothetical protein
MEMRELGTRSFQATCPTGEFMPSKRRSKWHDAVSHSAKAVLSIGKEGWVQPGIQPISISANRGFKTRLDGCPSGAVVPCWWVDAMAMPCNPIRPSAHIWLPSATAAVGVGQCVIACTAKYSPCLPASCVGVTFVDRFVFGDATGVAHNAACTFSGWLFRSNCGGPAVFFPSCTVGVDHIRACCARNGTRRPSWPVELPKLAALGVCQYWIWLTRFSPNAGLVFQPLVALGVAHGDPEAEPPFTAVRGARFLRAEYVPFTIEPEGDQGTEHEVEESSPISGKDSWDVLKKDKSRLNLGDDSPDVSPDEPFVGHAESPAGETDGLAWESRTDEIHRSTPRSAIEGANVIPDWSKVKGIVFHAGSEDRCREGGVFDIADGSDIGGESQSQVESADTGAQADGT